MWCVTKMQDFNCYAEVYYIGVPLSFTFGNTVELRFLAELGILVVSGNIMLHISTSYQREVSILLSGGFLIDSGASVRSYIGLSIFRFVHFILYLFL